jgi:hypothetical protein
MMHQQFRIPNFRQGDDKMKTKRRFTLALLLVLSVAFLGLGLPSALAKMTDK